MKLDLSVEEIADVLEIPSGRLRAISTLAVADEDGTGPDRPMHHEQIRLLRRATHPVGGLPDSERGPLRGLHSNDTRQILASTLRARPWTP
jgi:hypothetical protein